MTCTSRSAAGGDSRTEIPSRTRSTALNPRRAPSPPPRCSACSTPSTRSLHAAGLAGRLGLDPQGAEMLASTLVASGYLEREERALRNAPVSERLLVRSSPESIATFVGAAGATSTGRCSTCCRARSATARPSGCTRSAGTSTERWEGTSAACSRSRGRRTSGTPRSCPSRARAGWSTWPAGTAASRWRCAGATRALEATVLDLPPSAAVGRRDRGRARASPTG